MNPATPRQSRSYSDGISMTMFIPLNQGKKYGNPHRFMVSSLMSSCFGSTSCFISYRAVSYPTPLIFTTSSYLIGLSKFRFFQRHTTISCVTTHGTRTLHLSSIYGIPMVSEHSKPIHIHKNAISKLILRHYYDKETSAFR